jgi:hypothetical protein
MDAVNRFHTRDSWLLVRAEHLLVLVILIVLALVHLGEIHWGWFVLSLVALDVIGYLPGLIAYHRSGRGKIAPVYHT